MTGLDLFFSHIETLVSLSVLPKGDLERVARMVEAIQYEPTKIIQYAKSLTAFYNDIVNGLKNRKFVASEDTLRTFSLPCHTRVPRFLEALMSNVFGCSGALHEQWDVQSVETLLTTLALVKRIDSSETIAYANEEGVKSYFSSQAPRQSMTPALKYLMSKFWCTLLEEWSTMSTWGDLGPGALIDKDFPFERHFALPALFNVPAPAKQFLTECLRKRFAKGISLTSRRRGTKFEYHQFSIDNLITWLESPDCLDHPFVFAYASTDQPSRLSVVEKSCIISRPITVTYGWKAILGACIRATGKAILRKHGLDKCMNVNDQERSHWFLWKHFADAFTTDFKDGSGNFLHDDVDGSLPSIVSNLQRMSSTKRVVIRSDEGDLFEIDAITLQMGDSSCNFFLTGNTFFLQVAAIVEKRYSVKRDDGSTVGGVEFIYAHRFIDPAPFEREWMWSLIFEASRVCHCVGDDFIGLREWYEPFMHLLEVNNIRVNHRKSSEPDGIHKETCGAWILNHGTHFTEIFPFRAPKILPTFKRQTLLNCTQYLHKISGSELMCRQMMITLSKHLGNDGLKLLSLSRSLDEIGSPFGVGIPYQATPIVSNAPSDLDDDLRALFYFSEDVYPVANKEDERSKPQRYRLSVCTRYHNPYCSLSDREYTIRNGFRVARSRHHRMLSDRFRVKRAEVAALGALRKAVRLLCEN